MFTAFSKFITTLFNALNDFALAVGSIAVVAKETAGAYEDESRMTRAVAQLELNKQLGVHTPKLTNKATA